MNCFLKEISKSERYWPLMFSTGSTYISPQPSTPTYHIPNSIKILLDNSDNAELDKEFNKYKQVYEYERYGKYNYNPRGFVVFNENNYIFQQMLITKLLAKYYAIKKIQKWWRKLSC